MNPKSTAGGFQKAFVILNVGKDPASSLRLFLLFFL